MTPLERELVTLARKTCSSPAQLSPSDLGALRSLAGESAVEYAVVAGAFHFVNRIADLLHVDPEALPEGLRRFEWVRKAAVTVAARMLRRVTLANRVYEDSYAQAASRVCAALGASSALAAGAALEPLRPCPQALEILQLAIEERDVRSSLERATLARVHRGVEAALPRHVEETEGFHPRPDDPVDAFVFVGTRYASRTTPAMIDRLRLAGYDDLGILDLATAVADANQWARMHRLLGLNPALFYLS